MNLKHFANDSSSLRKLVYSLDHKILAFAPGTKFNPSDTYSNLAYDILGYLVQIISGKQYEDYIKDNVLSKTNKPYSSLDYNQIPIYRRTSPHILKGNNVKVGGIFIENMEHSPSGNLNSCSLDLCNWMIHHINIYNNSTIGILHNSTLQNMWTSRQKAPQNERVSIGLGWWITKSNDLGNYYWYVGGNPGFSATLMILPEHNFAITVLCNGMNAEQIIWNKIPFDIINLFKGEW